MRICHVTNSLTRTGGGTAKAIWGLACVQQSLGNMIDLVGLSDPYDGLDYPQFLSNSINVHTFKRNGPYGLGWSSALHTFINKECLTGNSDLLHQHGIWSLLSHSVRSLTRKHRIPTIIATHGMLSETALRQKYLKKKVFEAFVELGNLKRADCLHALCENEARGMREYGLSNPIAIVPNGIDVTQYSRLPEPGAFADCFPKAKGRPIVLYISRQHPLKGLAILIEAWKRLEKARRNGWLLVIAGQGKPKFERQLKQTITSLGLANDTLFTGALYGEKKLEALSASCVFVLPSLSEGFPMAVLEAMACRLPALITDRCNIQDVEKYQAGWISKPDVESLAETLVQCIEISDEQRKAKGQNGFNLVTRKYNWQIIAERTCEVYNWLLGNRDRPECILMD